MHFFTFNHEYLPVLPTFIFLSTCAIKLLQKKKKQLSPKVPKKYFIYSPQVLYQNRFPYSILKSLAEFLTIKRISSVLCIGTCFPGCDPSESIQKFHAAFMKKKKNVPDTFYIFLSVYTAGAENFFSLLCAYQTDLLVGGKKVFMSARAFTC